MNLYCKSCRFNNAMEYDSHCHNFICLSRRHGYEIFEFDDAGDLDLYVTKDTFIYLMQKGFLKSLMEIYNDRIWISTEQ